MIFTELRFVLLVVFCWGSFLFVPARHRLLVLAVWGGVFYGMFAGRYLPLVMVFVVITYLLTTGRAIWVLAASLGLVLVDFKLGADPIWFAKWLLAAAPESAAAALVLPLGFSFLVFELLHVAIDHYRGRIAGTRLDEILAFSFFFPCRVAGPIKRYPQFLEAVRLAAPCWENSYGGIVRILVGLFKKLVLADVLSLTVPEMAYAATPAHAWRALLAFSLSIYLDFSAYSDVALGTSRLFGIKIPENFRWPYLSPNIQEFWNRWHISLSSWARDYVFTPTGHRLFKTRLKRLPTLIAAASYLLTFLLIGAWHGLTPGFLVWGAYHGLLLTVYYVWRTRLPAAFAKSSFYQSRIATIAGTVLTFLLVTLGWLPFTMELPRAAHLLTIILGVSK